MKAPRKRDPFPSAGAAAGLLFVLLASGRAESLLTEVSFVGGAATYSRYAGESPEGPGRFSGSLHAGMAIPDSTRVEVAGDSKVVISPVPAVRLLLQPGTRFVNESFGFHENASNSKSFGFRVRLVLGTLVGDVAGPLRDVDGQFDTPRAVVKVSTGHFLLTVNPDGTTKCAVLRGSMTVSVAGGPDYHLGDKEELTVLSQSALRKQLAAAGEGPQGGTPEHQELGPAGDVGIIRSSLADDPEAVALLMEPFPEGSGEEFAGLLGPPPYDVAPGQFAPGLNPANEFNTPDNNPPVSPIFP